ncbi:MULTISPECIES: homoserine dehydrogenase [unclassified Beijerinckia]|uniref:homoserine dehydrogenase n=1 Tax=unclassified Beijerinckia TaxID=2638183 RepID=UPI00089C34F8|nr:MULTISPECIES: homoserine dehydrogenase [unclassified Beijerinckia]MDH7795628.1 homoserine dehydrogenase [Beijerinckia sp. GAS462]SEC09405.1 homoserine dehydrogenase [Beijerinckia sp. 28-YEA-48]
MSTPLRVGIAGLGTVGASVVRLLERQANSLAASTGRTITPVAVAARDRTRDRGIHLNGAKWFDDPVALATSPDIDLFVELIGGDEGPARLAVEAALRAGKPVVTANKALLAKHGVALAQLAEAKKVALAFEASVAGGIPIVKTLREGLAGNEISRVYGILNGTCNYILSRMELEKLSFDACLKDAQRLGYAEADPTFDIGGFDTAHKLAILTSLAFGVAVDSEAIHVEGIEQITLEDLTAADDLGYRIKLLGVAQRTAEGIEQRVHPTMVPKTSAIAQVMGVTNAVTIDADAVKELTLVGPGAGGDATASAVVADIADVARGIRSAPFGLPVAQLQKAPRREMQRHEGGYYIRLSVADLTGAAAAIATRMAERKISLESIMQKPRGGRDGASSGDPVTVVLLTYATTEANIRAALDAALSDGYIVGHPQVIRIERK